MRAAALLWIIMLWNCGGAGVKPESAARPEAPAPADQSQHFPRTGQEKMEIVTTHLLGKNFMPGGNLATYKNGKTEYRQFLGKMPDAQTAAFLLLDWKKALKDPQYLAHMGGYFGMDGDQSVYVFTKGAWVAGVTGLPQAKADIVAREFAARL